MPRCSDAQQPALCSTLTDRGEHSLSVAARYDQVEATRYILAHKIQTSQILDACDIGLRCDGFSALEVLYSHLLPMDKTFRSQCLQTACRSETPVGLRYLLENHGVDANHVIEGNSCAVHMLARLNKPHHIATLIERGANVTLKDATGQTAFEIALSHGHVGVVDILVTHAQFPTPRTRAQKEEIVRDCLRRLRPLRREAIRRRGNAVHEVEAVLASTGDDALRRLRDTLLGWKQIETEWREKDKKN
ncbi:uncharacterized protein PV07_12591 [Cladophialophora immunda]|uniref:Uncharacterized protein n=1 Tax=Cladophialophora immunda TaxID=569365 RepID=A0A0D1Z338_9EURO|nr:uncharacterized protein PV07_12591 [Cladophialophora immunda]KIW22006.1 hypothetical protein PV07_12591 [Cladophialophora immunda]